MTDASQKIRGSLAEPTVDSSTVDRVLDGAVRRRGAMVRRRRAVAGASVLAVVGVSVLVLRAPSRADALRRVDGVDLASIAATERASSVAFDDGSSVELSPSSALRVAHNDHQRIEWNLERGSVRFSVRPRGPRRWTIDAGAALVSVIGTEFVVDRASDRVRVSVSEGVVRVETREVHPRIHRLTAGQSVVIAVAAPGDRTPDPSSVAQSESDAASATVESDAASATIESDASALVEDGSTVTTSSSDGARVMRPTATRPAWRSLAEQGEYNRAYEMLGSDGVARASRGSSADSLLALADVARLSGHPAEAVAPLEQLLREHPADSSAPLAAYTLGRVFVALGRHGEASRSFERAISLGAPRAIEEDLRWLLVRSRNASGDRAGAERAAEEYRSRFSDGRHARAIDELLGARR